MNKLDELIQKLCPEGVPFKKLIDVCDYVDYRGKTPKKVESGIFLVTAKNIRKGYIDYESSKEYIASDDFDNVMRRGTAKIGDILITTEAPCGNVALVDREDIALAQRVIKYRCNDEINPRFLLHILLGKEFQNKLAKASTGGTVKGIKGSKLHLLEVPVPPLEAQKEIVRLLDDFTAKTAELQTELNKEYEARKKQYEYYRDTLLNDEEATRKVTLQDVAQYSKARISSSEVDETNYVGVDNLLQNKKGKVNSNHVPTSGNLTEFQSGDILIGNIRPYLQKIWLSDKTGGTNGDVLDIRPNQKLVTPPFLYQVLASDRFFNYDMQNSKGAKMPRGNKEKVMEYSFALPTLERQREIVLLLNKFEIAFNDLQSNISIELESRQKQYEFYRDKLLTFKELN